MTSESFGQLDAIVKRGCGSTIALYRNDNEFDVFSNTVQYNCCERVAARILDISNWNLPFIGQNIKVNLVQSILQK